MIELVKKFCNRETISYLIFGILTTIVNQVTFEICKFCSQYHHRMGFSCFLCLYHQQTLCI